MPTVPLRATRRHGKRLSWPRRQRKPPRARLGGDAAPTATETVTKVVTSFAPEALYRDGEGKTLIVDPGAFTHPGGAYEDGAFGPEQILCSESNLYPVLCAHKRDFYDKNRDYRRGSLFTDRALYVPEVLFSRESDTRRADVLVIAEPIRAYALENHRSERECDKALADRIETIFRIAAANGTETLIVGAFGCGRNGYPVEQVIGAHPELDRGTPRRRAERGVRCAAHARRCLPRGLRHPGARAPRAGGRRRGRGRPRRR